MKEPNVDEAVEEALSECSAGASRLVKLELREIPAEFYLDPRIKKMSKFDVSHNALQSIPKVSATHDTSNQRTELTLLSHPTGLSEASCPSDRAQPLQHPAENAPGRPATSPHVAGASQPTPNPASRSA